MYNVSLHKGDCTVLMCVQSTKLHLLLMIMHSAQPLCCAKKRLCMLHMAAAVAIAVPAAFAVHVAAAANVPKCCCS